MGPHGQTQALYASASSKTPTGPNCPIPMPVVQLVTDLASRYPGRILYAQEVGLVGLKMCMGLTRNQVPWPWALVSPAACMAGH